MTDTVILIAVGLMGAILASFNGDLKSHSTALTELKERVATSTEKSINIGKSLDEIKSEQRDMRQEFNRKFDQLLQRVK